MECFIDDHVRPVEQEIQSHPEIDRAEYRAALVRLRIEAQDAGLWLPHMSAEWGGMGLGPVALAMVQSEAARSTYGPWALNCQAPDEGNQHSIAHWGTDEQKERYLRPLCEGLITSCFAMTEPDVAGSDPTLMQTRAVLDGDEWIINGHKWFITNARRASVAVLIARTEDDPPVPQAATSAFLVDLPSPGWNNVRDVETMHSRRTGTHSEIRIENLRVPAANLLGGRGNGHRLGQYRLGPARLAHCMRWLAQAEMVLDMIVDRSAKRYAHGSLLSEKQAIQWMIADSAMELYQGKLMVLHAAYQLESGEDFTTQVAMAKHFVANSLCRIVDRAIQVHGALGYSNDTPLAALFQQARWARIADGPDEIHQMRIAERFLASHHRDGRVRAAFGELPL